MAEQDPRNLEQLLDVLASAQDGSKALSIGELLDTVGRRSFGPLLLVAGLIGISPVSGVPGVPTLIAVGVVIVASQLLMNRSCFWLPGWLTRRELKQSKLEKVIKFMQPVARWVDRILRPRFCMLTSGVFVHVIAGICIVIALTMPPLELVPFSATTTSAALTAFGLALIARDGLVAAVGMLIFVTSIGLAIYLLINKL
jgi:hypothetical protein